MPTIDLRLAGGMGQSHSCACIGPQRGEPLCPCQMRGIIIRDGRYIRPEQDLGPVVPAPPKMPLVSTGHGCVCPPGAEATCQGMMCPRRPVRVTSAVASSEVSHG